MPLSPLDRDEAMINNQPTVPGPARAECHPQFSTVPKINTSPDQDAEYRSPYDEIRDSIGREIEVALASQPAIQRDADKETH